MSSKTGKSEDKEASLTPRRIQARRRSRSRVSASPGRGPLNNGLMNAAWPKTQTYRPTKPSSSKTSEQQWISKGKVPHSSDQIEEMEVDSHDPSVMLSNGAVTELNVMKTRNSVDSKNIGMKEYEGSERTAKSVTKADKETTAAVHRLSNPVKVAMIPIAVRRPVPIVPKNSGNFAALGKQSKPVAADNKRDASVQPVFIILHAGTVNIPGKMCGQATAPVKIYGERIIIQIEEEATNKSTTMRILCNDLREVQMNLEEHPFSLQLKTCQIYYMNQSKMKSKDNKKEALLETVKINLAYEVSVPPDVKEELKSLEKLRHLNLWRNAMSPNASPSTEKGNNERSTTKITMSPSARVNSAPVLEGKIGVGCRKRTPEKNSDEQTVPVGSSQDCKLARRILFQETDNQQERIKSLESEAAHYQLLLGHKRLEIQQLEEQIHAAERSAVVAREEAYSEISRRDNEICQLQKQVDSLNLQISEEKESKAGYRQQISELSRELERKDTTLKEQQQAILVRESQLKEVRNIAVSPSKMNEQELREEIRRLKDSLRQARANLDDTRRSKSCISEELRKSVDILGNVREQLRNETSRCRRFENEASRATQQVNELTGTKRAIQVELNDERDRVASLERDILICRRRIENEINHRREIEDECRNMRSLMNEKDRVIESIRNERDNTVTEVGILKREIYQLNEQLESEQTNARSEDRNVFSSQNRRQPNMESHDWVLDRNEIHIHGTVLGVGGWGQVKLGKFRGTEVAVKQIHHLILSQHNRRLFNREMTIASRCRHPCLLQFIGATCDDGTPLFVSELLETDLRSHLSQNALRPTEVVAVGLDIALALNYLHKQKPLPIIHRDISSSNVLLWYKGRDMHAKLSDYGAANFMRLSMTRHPGASLYSAPETASGEQTPKVDIYSFGVMFCEMSIRELPVTEQRDQQIRLMGNQDYRVFVQRCIEADPVSRPDSEETVNIFAGWKALNL
eukprot:gene17603-9244_t